MTEHERSTNMRGDDRSINMTEDEINRFVKAFRDDKFRGMLREYAEELSNPENKKKYEEEITLLEQERGNTIEFIHPEPFKALKTSLNGKQKCYINICANGKVAKPECSWGVSEDGRRGQRWSLPHNLHPGREDRDAKGNKIVIYDVIFHPDTLHIASKNKRFMDMVDSTAIQGVQGTFKVVLDQKNMTEMKTKYKGTPQPCVIRKPIPGFKAKEPPEEPDPLACPYPDDRGPTKPTEPPATKDNTDSRRTILQIQPEKTKEPTKPTYTIKYRSFIDLQDFRLSRDSAQSPRPKEIVVTFDVPLLKSVTDTSVEVQGKSLLLESKTPAYRLEVPLAYPVDEDKGEAKFNKQKGQLTVTLPVLPSKESFDLAVGQTQTVSHNERQEEAEETTEQMRKDEKTEDDRGDEEKCPQREGEKGEDEEETGAVEEEEKLKEQKTESQEGVGEERRIEEDRCNLPLGERPEEADGGGVEEEEKWEEQRQGGENSEVEEERQGEEKQEGQDEQNEDDKGRDDGRNGAACTKDSGFQCVQQSDISAEDQSSVLVDDMRMDSPETENQPTAEQSSDTAEEHQVELDSCSVSAARVTPEDAPDVSGKTQENVDNSEGNPNEVEPQAAFLSEESQSDHSSTQALKEVAPGSVNSEDTDEDDLTAEQIFKGSAEHDTKPPPALLREVDADGNETVISDHSTSAGFTFQNSLVYELD